MSITDRRMLIQYSVISILVSVRQTKISSPDAIGNILLPQMNNDLKAQIMARTEAKLLTPQHVALAPSISFE